MENGTILQYVVGPFQRIGLITLVAALFLKLVRPRDAYKRRLLFWRLLHLSIRQPSSSTPVARVFHSNPEEDLVPAASRPCLGVLALVVIDSLLVGLAMATLSHAQGKGAESVTKMDTSDVAEVTVQGTPRSTESSSGGGALSSSGNMDTANAAEVTVRGTPRTSKRSSGGGAHSSVSTIDTPDAVEVTVRGTPRAPSMGGVSSGYADPDAFKFERANGNSRVTGCTVIRFTSGGGLFKPPVVVDIGVVVWAPIKLHNGHRVSVREAQVEASNAANWAGEGVLQLLVAGLPPSKISIRFREIMLAYFMELKLGYRVQRCNPN